jgi:hypothetical protein
VVIAQYLRPGITSRITPTVLGRCSSSGRMATVVEEDMDVEFWML